ncbi:DUF4178 domain-containing protein [Actinocatenispora sera]|uniref:DUF4178 domain-containing protein n=1 Tax=Actinocatenispora sera TaxID=390989 RepID=A0A810KY14_9ACTN|nr:DUF4178 domain-containing protein [Actinocatenispora sera]BCJ27289.1 hypothetical protein Asera_13970 [Actinocatenispora sera]
MTTVIVALLVVIAALLVVVIVLLRLRSRRPVAAPPIVTDPFADTETDVLTGDPRRLTAGDTVEIRGTTWSVRGTLRFTEGGSRWSEHLLDDAHGARVWLSVEEDPDLLLALWTQVHGSELTPGPRVVHQDGARFVSDESGTADYRSEGSTGLATAGTMAYHDYTGDGDALLGFEKYGSGGWELARGQRLARRDVRVFTAR